MPKLVTLCGSSRFVDVMAVCGWLLERDEGVMTMGLHLLPTWYPDCPPHHLAEQEGVAERVGELHLAKIGRSDAIFVVDVDGYLGQSTKEQIAYAKKCGIPVRFFSADPIGEMVQTLGERSKKNTEPQTLYAVSVRDGDRYHNDLFDALLEAGIDPAAGLEMSVMRGTRNMFRASRFAPNVVPELLSGMDQESDFDGGEWADDWPGEISDEHEQDLEHRINAAVDIWADQYGYQPTFAQVTDTEAVKVRILDIEARTFEVVG